MTLSTASADLAAASARFRSFFEELNRTFVEREDLLAQIAMALLGREHVLMTGPPGTAKSGIAAAVLGRIVDERTGQPSLFARQFTESTVQTDLVGPIDFKTLMATGRTEHFTDEGMLGAVHAFLDEVLDGRDMLLRTTLNVLHERELKQGAKTTRGAIECALMTTNRYLAEVLDGSRETLLAFVDRIAFVGFVPKGFASPDSLGRVLRSQVGGVRARSLEANLTIQDLDVLQATADRIVVPDAVCGSLCALLEHLDRDLAHAAKSDPTFTPTRYLSTRTAVRLGRILRAVCLYDAIMRNPTRELEVGHDDLAGLRLSLLLSGPPRESLTALIDKESDPRERRQLSILRTEREMFERALARVPRTERASRPSIERDVAALQQSVDAAVPVADPRPLLATAATLAHTADSGGPTAPAAAELLATALTHLSERALRAGITAGASATEVDVIGELSSLADGLEASGGAARPTARWLRARAIRMVLDTAALAGSRVGAALDGLLPVDASLDDVARRAMGPVERLERLLETAAKLRAAGADDSGPESFERASAVAVARVEDELVEVWDVAFRDAVARALAEVGPEKLGELLGRLVPVLQRIDGFGERLARCGADRWALKGRVVGPRIEPLVRAAFERVQATDRPDLVAQVGALVDELDRAGLKGVIATADLIRLATLALVRGERGTQSTQTQPPSHTGYRQLRAGSARVSLAYTLVELGLRIAPTRATDLGSPAEMLTRFGATLADLPAELRAEVVALDVARVERAVSLVERWWAELGPAAETALSSGSATLIGTALPTLAGSRFFHVTRDEGALLRFAIEARVIGEVFAEAAAATDALRARIEAVEAESSRVLVALQRGRSDAGWTTLLDTAARRVSR